MSLFFQLHCSQVVTLLPQAFVLTIPSLTNSSPDTSMAAIPITFQSYSSPSPGGLLTSIRASPNIPSPCHSLFFFRALVTTYQTNILFIYLFHLCPNPQVKCKLHEGRECYLLNAPWVTPRKAQDTLQALNKYLAPGFCSMPRCRPLHSGSSTVQETSGPTCASEARDPASEVSGAWAPAAPQRP